MFRDGINSSDYIFYFSSNSSSSAHFSFDTCKFGSKGINLDDPSYTGTVSSDRMNAYVYVSYACRLSVKNCIINYNCTGSSNSYAFYADYVQYTQYENIKVYTVTESSSRNYAVFYTHSGDLREFSVKNVSMEVMFNGTNQYITNRLLYMYTKVIYGEIKNVSITMSDRNLGSSSPTQLYATNLIYWNRAFNFNGDTISVSLPKCWNLTTYLLCFYNTRNSGYFWDETEFIKYIFFYTFL